ncbi:MULTISPECIES: aromatic amino acid ammonia-lyase [Amycolatopsis]|uniref:Aromatic amino acid lyase n=1 Tax=Amycolatopsis dendrobii TaxID=2760662 RepID=A0A7W3ZA91_9PSEU|nr:MULTISPECIES: aromatic amino acid ammonia-lyase [Amycolatopsis]MBB1153657.1 aromatic amino acid lyase [Amycolatopsis dendrobii]UKD55602.1 aromatic amino acid ammonia-lyase [Amycolatopsis sp. FU40]
MIRVDGRTLRCADVVTAAHTDGPLAIDVSIAALRAAEHSWKLAEDLSTRRVVYGRTTGVGANKDDAVDEPAEHGLRLLRSHAGGSGDLLPDGQIRAMLLIRLNQLLTGRSGISPELIGALAEAVRTGALPVVHRLGAIGTGDLAPLAETALALAGERAWSIGSVPPVPVHAGDALAFMSSNAATLAEATLAAMSLDTLTRASHAVAALTYVALDGNPEAYATPVHEARPHAGQVACAAEMRRLLGMHSTPRPGRRLQDPFGLRAFPQVQGPALDAIHYLRDVLAVEINASTENPMISTVHGDAYHHAHFHTAYVSTALDQARATVHQVAELSVARLGDLVEPEFTGLRPFLAVGPPGSSGVMILEYVAHDALTELRQAALPATLGTAVVSRGIEDHASFSTQAARAATAAAAAYRQVLACELVAAVRALRIRKAELVDLPVRAAFAAAVEVLDERLEDRPLTEDIAKAAGVLDELARI